MGQKSKIEWTDASWNPIVGCTKVSEGCRNCYAKTLHDRRHKVYYPDQTLPIQYAEPFETIQLKPERLDFPLHWKKPRMIFVNSMSDLFHEDVPFEFIANVFATIRNSIRHTYQILTKRPKRILEYFDWFYDARPYEILSNVWLGVSVENQATADERIPLLLQVPAAVRFLSCEPLLDGINVSMFTGDLVAINDQCEADPVRHGVDWVIVGGESGPGYRPMSLDWARSIRNQCASAGVPFFFKQTTGKKEIPDDLQIRQFPTR